MPAMPRIRLSVQVLCVAVALTCATGHGTSAQDQGAADAYDALLDRYQRGQTEEAVQALATLDPDRVANGVATALRDARSWPTRRAQAAVLLHTDAVVDGWVPPSRVSAHLDVARRMADLQKGALVGREFRRDWLLVVAWFLQSEADLASARIWVDRLLAEYPTDGDALVTAGAFFEATAGNSGLSDPLESAVSIYRRVPPESPAFAQAQVRLGRTWLQLQRPADALRPLEPAPATASEDWRYLARVFSAAAYASTRRYTAAADAYEEALDLLPSCQTPLIGLAAVRRAEGRTAEAAALVDRLTTMDTSHCDDPWWHYRFGQTPERRARLLLSLRARVTAP